MRIFRRTKRLQTAEEFIAQATNTPSYTLRQVQAEWPKQHLKKEQDLQRWAQGMDLYKRDDYESMMRCSQLLSPALAHAIHGQPILPPQDSTTTIHNVLFASVTPPTSGDHFAEHAQKSVRLAMTLMRENGLQPRTYGGRGTISQELLDASLVLYRCALAGPDEFISDINEFFAQGATLDAPLTDW